MTDYTKMDGPALQEACGDRAELWAEAFVQHMSKIGIGRLSDADTMEWLTGWFANAIEQSHTVRMRRHLAEPSPTWREEAGRAGPIACSLSGEEVSAIRRRMISEGRRGPITEEDARACIAARPAWPGEADRAFWDGSQWAPEQARMIAASAKS